MKIRSKYFNDDIEVTENVIENDQKEIVLIPHAVLEDLIYHDEHCREMEIRVEFTESPHNTRDHYVWSCRISDSTGYAVEEVGESTPESLTNDVSRMYPSLMAHKRAFDIAAITFLGFDRTRIYSDLEILEGQARNYSDLDACDVSEPLTAEEIPAPEDDYWKAYATSASGNPALILHQTSGKQEAVESAEDRAAKFTITFGQYHDQSLLDVFNQNPEYVSRIIEKTKNDTLRELAKELIAKGEAQ